MSFDFNKQDLQVYLESKPPNINPLTGYRFHRTNFTGGFSQYHTHEYYEFFLSLDGSSIHYVNDKEQPIVPGSLVFVRPEDKHCYETSDKGFVFLNVAFTKRHKDAVFSYFSGIYDLSSLITSELPPMVQLLPHDVKIMQNKLNNINTFLYDNYIEQQLYIRRILIELFSKFYKSENTETDDEIPYWLAYAYKEMQKTDNFVRGISRMAEISQKSPEHLSRSMKKYYNITPSQYINELRLNYATNLLANSSFKIVDICFESGFANLSTFYSAFYNFHKMTPKEYRNQQT